MYKDLGRRGEGVEEGKGGKMWRERRLEDGWVERSGDSESVV